MPRFHVTPASGDSPGFNCNSERADQVRGRRAGDSRSWFRHPARNSAIRRNARCDIFHHPNGRGSASMLMARA